MGAMYKYEYAYYRSKSVRPSIIATMSIHKKLQKVRIGGEEALGPRWSTITQHSTL